MNQSLYKKDYSDEDESLEIIEEQEEIVKNTPEPSDPEEENWKKRYGNLRTHAQKEKQAFENRIANLETQVQEVSKENTNIPVDPEQFKEWVNTYPTVANNVKLLIQDEIKSLKEDINKTKDTIKERDAQSQVQAAKVKFNQMHPEFYGGDNPIVKDKKFLDWLNEKEEAGNPSHKKNFEGNNIQLASDSVKLFKLETGYGEKKPKQKANSNGGADSIKSRSQSAPSYQNTGEYQFTESQISKMNPREFDRLEKEIDDAYSKGLVLRDI